MRRGYLPGHFPFHHAVLRSPDIQYPLCAQCWSGCGDSAVTQVPLSQAGLGHDKLTPPPRGGGDKRQGVDWNAAEDPRPSSQQSFKAAGRAVGPCGEPCWGGGRGWCRAHQEAQEASRQELLARRQCIVSRSQHMRHGPSQSFLFFCSVPASLRSFPAGPSRPTPGVRPRHRAAARRTQSPGHSKDIEADSRVSTRA